MISLNMKLQSSAAKNQARNIDLEIKKLEARESKELLSIVQVHFTSYFLSNHKFINQFNPALPSTTIHPIRFRRNTLLPFLPPPFLQNGFDQHRYCS